MSFHEDFHREQAAERGSDRPFGFVMAGAFAIVAAWPLLSGAGPRSWALAIAGAFLAVALVKPALLGPLNRVWMAFGRLLHHIVSPVVMGAIFAIVVVPTALGLRLFGKDPLRLKLDRQAASYWLPRQPPGPVRGSLKQQF